MLRAHSPLTRAFTPYFCLLPRWPSLQREILPTGASRAWKCHPEIQGRDNLLCVLVVCGGLNAGMVYETYTLLTYFLTFICLLLTLRKIYPNHRKLQSHHLNFTPVELDAIWRKINSFFHKSAHTRYPYNRAEMERIRYYTSSWIFISFSNQLHSFSDSFSTGKENHSLSKLKSPFSFSS